VPINLSYSAISTYLTCSEKYRLERVEKIPQEYAKTPLWFGSSIDSASSVIFNDKINDFFEYEEYSWDRAVRNFEHSLTYVRFNDKMIDTRYNKLVRYSKADFDLRLLQDEDLEKIRMRSLELEFEDFDKPTMEEFVEYCQGIKGEMDELDLLMYNYIGYHCLYRKGLLLLKAIKDWSDKNVKEVISTQRYFRITNEDGDNYSGLLDLEAILNDGKQYTIDLKTASNPKQQYPENCIDTSMQLHSYAEVGSKLVGYLVLGKSIRVKEPKVDLREVYGEVTDEMLDKSFDIIDNVMQDIKSGKFEKNRDGCFSFGPCPHMSRCFPRSKK
jgi:hypothetical protein